MYCKMASSPPSLCLFIKTSPKHTCRFALKVRAQSSRDEGRLGNIVDANLSVLRGRIEEIRIKERFERCYKCKYGWNYAPGCNGKLKKDTKLSESFELAGLIGGTFGLTCLSGTVLLSLVSILVHMNQ